MGLKACKRDIRIIHICFFRRWILEKQIINAKHFKTNHKKHTHRKKFSNTVKNDCSNELHCCGGIESRDSAIGLGDGPYCNSCATATVSWGNVRTGRNRCSCNCGGFRLFRPSPIGRKYIDSGRVFAYAYIWLYPKPIIFQYPRFSTRTILI